MVAFLTLFAPLILNATVGDILSIFNITILDVSLSFSLSSKALAYTLVSLLLIDIGDIYFSHVKLSVLYSFTYESSEYVILTVTLEFVQVVGVATKIGAVGGVMSILNEY
ncbi:hypothetical protein D3C76_1293840 [compost metagenome]